MPAAAVLKLGYKDSNLEMTESESVALPFGDSPIINISEYEVFKLGYKDSNLEMTESESVALPFGDSPSLQRKSLYLKLSSRSSTFLSSFSVIFV